MSRWIPSLPMLALALAAGCTSSDPSGTEPRGAHEMWVGEQIRSASIDQAIWTQRTVFPYHFHAGSARLNPLGRRDLAVLSRRYLEEPGELSVRRAWVPEELHQARVEHVVAFLEAQGIGRDRVRLVDAPADGEGISSERLLLILASPGLQGGADGGGAADGASIGGAR